jgi:4-amino-4-deoxy-L-arabinose transferase-like glycosyltransferase
VRLPTAFFAAPWNLRLLLALACLLHFALGASTGLSVDEAHYALYATHLALSYFDHPPLVGWLQWPLVALDAPTAILRLIPELLWLGTALLVYRIAVRLQGEPAGFWAVLALALAPLLHVLGVGLLPDSLLMFFTAALMLQTLVLMDAQTVQRPAPWLVLGVLLGLAGLSKYTAIFAALAAAVCLLNAHGVRLLRSPWPWAAAGVALLLVLPVLVWNAQNQWISFTYQAQHGAGNAWQVTHVLRFLLLQVLVFGPLLLWGASGVWRTAQPLRTLGLWFAIPFGVLAVMAGGGSSLPHWTAPAWVALAPFAGVALAHAVQRRGRLWVGVLSVVQALLCVGFMGLMASGGAPLLPAAQLQAGDPPNPFADLHGWEQAGQRARALAQEHPLTSVAVQNWTLASRLGWYARPLPVHVLEDRYDQFDWWAGDLPQGGNTLLVDWSQMSYDLPQAPHGFAGCTLLDTQDVVRLGRPLSRFWFYACQSWSGDPQPRLKTAP